MRRTAWLVFLVSSLHAADLEGPMLGYVNSRGGVRKVLGIVGAARLTAPLTGELQGALVLPGSDSVVAKNPSGALVRLNLKDGSLASLGIEDVSDFVVSPEGGAVLASVGGRLRAVSASGEPKADYASPGTLRLMAIADGGGTLALSVAEAEGEALYILDSQGSRRVFRSSRIAALAFVPGSSDAVFAAQDGAIYRLRADLQLSQVAAVSGTTALGATSEGMVIAVAGTVVSAIPLNGSPSSRVECACDATTAKPLGRSRFLLTGSIDGPMWIVDASVAQLRVAFIPEAVNE